MCTIKWLAPGLPPSASKARHQHATSTPPHAFLCSTQRRPGSTLLQHNECAGCSLTMEAELWRHVRHVRKLYYQVWERSDFAGGRVGRDAPVIIKPLRLAFLVSAALNRMSDPP